MGGVVGEVGDGEESVGGGDDDEEEEEEEEEEEDEDEGTGSLANAPTNGISSGPSRIPHICRRTV